MLKNVVKTSEVTHLFNSLFSLVCISFLDLTRIMQFYLMIVLETFCHQLLRSSLLEAGDERISLIVSHD